MRKASWIVLTEALLILLPSIAQPEDWPQWRGLNRDGTSAETGLLKQWPEGGPPLIWSVDGIGKGYSSISVAGGTAYATGMVGSTGYVFAFGSDGLLQWCSAYGPEWLRGYGGPRSTATIDSGKAYVFTAHGPLVCLDARTCELIWPLDTAQEFQAKKVVHGICENALIAGDLAICTPGGPGASVIAVNKHTGKLAWQTKDLSEQPGYNSTLLIQSVGKPVVVALTAGSLVGLDAETGSIRWRHTYDEKGQAWPCAIKTKLRVSRHKETPVLQCSMFVFPFFSYSPILPLSHSTTPPLSASSSSPTSP